MVLYSIRILISSASASFTNFLTFVLYGFSKGSMYTAWQCRALSYAQFRCIKKIQGIKIVKFTKLGKYFPFHTN